MGGKVKFSLLTAYCGKRYNLELSLCDLSYYYASDTNGRVIGWERDGGVVEELGWGR